MQQLTTDNTTAPTPADGESFATILAEVEQSRDFREGAVLDALVLDYDGNRVSVDVGLKSQSHLSAEEFRNDEGEIVVTPNEFVKVKLELLDDGRGNTRLSHLQYRREMAWEKIVAAHANDGTVEGVIRERIKGGYSVHIDGLRMFLPGSLVDLFPVKNDTDLLGKRERFYIERLKEDRMSAILNRRLVRERELTGADLNNLDFEVGAVFDGTVVAVVDYPDFTAYVRIKEGVHGVLERSDIAWQRIGNVSDVLKIDDIIQIKILEIDKEKKIIKLGCKQLVPDPWEQIEVSYPVNSRIFAKVTSIKEYGAFVEIEKGIEGLVHTSEMDWLQRNVQPQKLLTVGQEVEVMVLNYNKTSRRISLGLKQCRPNPWEEFSISYRKGSRIKGVVSGCQESLGLFIDLPGGLSGLAHLSNLSYVDTNGRATMKKYANGQEIEVLVLEVDVEKQRVHLGLKQLEQNPYEEFRIKYDNRETVTGVVKEVLEKGARILLGERVKGFLPISEISDERIESVSDKLSVGDEISLQIIEMEKNNVILSMKASSKAKNREAMIQHRQRFKEEAKEKAEKSSFGSMVRRTLGSSFQDTENQEQAVAPAVPEPESEQSQPQPKTAPEIAAEQSQPQPKTAPEIAAAQIEEPKATESTAQVQDQPQDNEQEQTPPPAVDSPTAAKKTESEVQD